MATRLYFTSNAFAGPVYPADAGWNDVTQCTTQSSDMSTTPSGDAHYAQTAQKNSAANPHTVLHARFKLALPSGITLQGNVRGQFFAQCPGTLGAMRAISVRVFDSGTGLRANLIQHFPGSLSSDFTGTLTNRNYPPSAAIPTPYVTVSGDVLVVEVGAKWFTAASGAGVTAAIRFGDAGTVDLPVDETTGVAAPEQNGWIEFQDVNIFGNLNPFLMTASGAALVTRPAAPAETPGLHFVDIGTLTHHFWTGVKWDRLFPESLATFADRTKRLTLTAEGADPDALLKAEGFGSVGDLFLQAPNSSGGANVLAIGKWGNIGVAQGQTSDDILMNFQKTDFNNANLVSAINGNLVQTGSGTVRGLSMIAKLQPTAGNASGNTFFFFQPEVNSNATGALTAFHINPRLVGAVTRGDFTGLKFSMSIQQGTYTTWRAAHITGATGGTITTQVGLDIDGITTGTTRRALRTSVTNESTAGDWFTSAAAKGLVTKDGQGTAHYWRWQSASDGTPYIADTGTSAPAA